MKREPLIYGIIGVLIGGIVVWLMASNAVNNNLTGMMQMMGMRGQNMIGNSQIDRHFIEQMIPHHQDAITMAELALEKATHQEIKKLAEDIKKSQSEEIENMRSWYKDWYCIEVSDGNTETMGMMMHGGMMGDDTDIESIKNASDFDKAFIEEMIPHHQMAAMMAQMLERGTSREEMKDLAQDIIDAQTKEINDMRSWYKVWYR